MNCLIATIMHRRVCYFWAAIVNNTLIVVSTSTGSPFSSVGR